MELLHKKIFELLLEPDLFFFFLFFFSDFLNIKLGGGEDTLARVCSPHPVFLTDHVICYLD